MDKKAILDMEREMRYSESYRKALHQEYQSIIRDTLKITLKHGIAIDIDPQMLIAYEQNRLLHEKYDKRRKSDYCFMTINPPESTEVSHFANLIHKVFKKKWIYTPFYCFEQRSDVKEVYKGVHCHCLFRRQKGKDKFDMIKEVSSTMKLEKNSIHFKYVSDEDTNNFINYIKGIKKEKPDKNNQQQKENDFQFRILNNLLNTYGVFKLSSEGLS